MPITKEHPNSVRSVRCIAGYRNPIVTRSCCTRVSSATRLGNALNQLNETTLLTHREFLACRHDDPDEAAMAGTATAQSTLIRRARCAPRRSLLTMHRMTDYRSVLSLTVSADVGTLGLYAFHLTWMEPSSR